MHVCCMRSNKVSATLDGCVAEKMKSSFVLSGDYTIPMIIANDMAAYNFLFVDVTIALYLSSLWRYWWRIFNFINVNAVSATSGGHRAMHVDLCVRLYSIGFISVFYGGWRYAWSAPFLPSGHVTWWWDRQIGIGPTDDSPTDRSSTYRALHLRCPVGRGHDNAVGPTFASRWLSTCAVSRRAYGLGLCSIMYRQNWMSS